MPSARRILALIALALSAIAISACGGDDEAESGSSDQGTMSQPTKSTSTGAAVDRAFATAMVPHHESAIEMATIAREEGESDFVRNLAEDIVSTQQAEIDTLKRVDAELEADGATVGDLGVADHMMGMDDDPAELRGADPFDRAFVNMMIPHHQGAIAMAKAELANGETSEFKQLAEAIIEAQQREIDEMNAFRKEQSGGGSPESMDNSHTGSSSGQNKAHATPEAMEE